MVYRHHTKKNQVLSLGLHPDLLELIDIRAHSEFKTRSFFIREAIAKALIERGAIADLENNEVFRGKLLELCGEKIAPGSAIIEPSV